MRGFQVCLVDKKDSMDLDLTQFCYPQNTGPPGDTTQDGPQPGAALRWRPSLAAAGD